VFILHLRAQEHPVVRNAILICLCDLAMKYTSLVDRFIPLMANMLRDKNVLLRKQAAMIISSLLSEEFIKFKGQMMIRILYAIADPVVEIKDLIESVFVRILIPRTPNIFSNFFVDHICCMNNWHALPKFDNEPVGEVFSLQRQPRKRGMIYRFMLSTMSNEQKFGLVQHIVKDIVGAFVEMNDRKQPIPTDSTEPAYSALCDALALLGARELKVCFVKDTTDPDDDDPEGMAELAAAAASGGAAPADDAPKGPSVGDKARVKILGAVMKRNLTEMLIPMLLELRVIVVQGCSPLLKNVDQCLKEVLVDYRTDMDSVIRRDDSLLIREIEFDMKEQAHVVMKERPALMNTLETLSPLAKEMEKQEITGDNRTQDSGNSSGPVGTPTPALKKASFGAEQKNKEKEKDSPVIRDAVAVVPQKDEKGTGQDKDGGHKTPMEVDGTKSPLSNEEDITLADAETNDDGDVEEMILDAMPDNIRLQDSVEPRERKRGNVALESPPPRKRLIFDATKDGDTDADDTSTVQPAGA